MEDVRDDTKSTVSETLTGLVSLGSCRRPLRYPYSDRVDGLLRSSRLPCERPRLVPWYFHRLERTLKTSPETFAAGRTCVCDSPPIGGP